MTTARMTPSSHSRRRRRGGFTLVELLVVIGIIVLIASIATPMVVSARRNANRVRVQSDLNAIATALDAYKNDFKDYPRPTINPADPNTARVPVLAWALLGPWPAAAASGGFGDGADGFGFRTVTGGKVHGPYLSPEKFPVDNKDQPLYLLDHFGSKIEYLPRWRSATPGRQLFGVASNGDPMTAGIANVADANTLAYDCRQATDPRAVYYFQRALGDGSVSPFTHNDRIDGQERILQDAPPFLLLSLSYKKEFSTKEEVDQHFDDPKTVTEVTNLQRP